MSFTRESAVERSKGDLAARLGVNTDDISKVTVTDADFPDMSLGAPTNGEMAAQMISSGWRIGLTAAGKEYEYRADKNQIRLYNFNGSNFVITSS